MSERSSVKPSFAIVAVVVLVATAAVVAAVATPTRRVILYGDSLAFESRDHFSLAMQSGGNVEAVERTFGGTAICDPSRPDAPRRP